MKLNCKQGDLAVIVLSRAGNEGKIVRCVEYMGLKNFREPWGEVVMEPTWRINQKTTGWAGDTHNFARDSCLRPIRDQDGEDEMLRIAGLPAPVKQEGETV